MKLNSIRIRFYENEVKLLNIVAAIIVAVDCFEYFNASLNFYRMLWSSVCIAATIFIDCCVHNVFKELAHKKVATIIIALIIIFGLVTISGLFF